MEEKYDIIVVGAGHAGCEAAAAAANLGSKVLLITIDMTKFAQMSCNPAIGGIAKGQLVREIDALGGYTGIVTDRSMIQFRMLNVSKGPAMWSPRAQCDRMLFSLEWRSMLEKTPNLDFWQDNVNQLIIRNHCVYGVKTQGGMTFESKIVILSNGTFLNGLMHVGKHQTIGGRAAEPAATGLTEQLMETGFTAGRMKTGTPARLDGRTIDFNRLSEQEGDNNPKKFSFSSNTVPLAKQRSCYIVFTSKEVHNLLSTGFNDSPLFNGTIQSIGPRYCPSIEDKVVTFAEKDKHLLFLEPEGWDTVEYYLNGFSSSLPWDVQYKAMRRIKGLEKVKIFRPGYAIEYDYFDPTQLKATMETKLIENLYFTGQINGTTGYEEAAAQGLIAGINAHNKLNGKPDFVLQRDEAYIGVLIDDLITKGVNEPYRMFTSRAEYRILLRQDNADLRLTEKGFKVGLADKKRFDDYCKKKEAIEKLTGFIKNFSVKPRFVNPILEKAGTAPLKQGVKLATLITRPELNIKHFIDGITPLKEFLSTLPVKNDDVIESVEIEIKYEGYIDREHQLAQKMKRLENIAINPDFDYNKLHSISTEARQKLSKIKPKTIGQAARISGVSPADINVLLVTLGR